MLWELGDGLKLNRGFLDIIEAGTDIKFEHAHNAKWDKYTLPELQAFWHAKYMLEKMTKYGKEFESAPRTPPSGWASVLYLYNHPMIKLAFLLLKNAPQRPTQKSRRLTHRKQHSGNPDPLRIA